MMVGSRSRHGRKARTGVASRLKPRGSLRKTAAQGPRGFLRREDPEAQKHGADLNLISLAEAHRPCPDPFAFDESPVLATEILDRGVLLRDADAGVSPGNRVVVDPGGRLWVAAEDVLARPERDFFIVPDEDESSLPRGSGGGTGFRGLSGESVTESVQVRRNFDPRGESPIARRASFARLARFASETNVRGQSFSCSCCLERARGRSSISSSSRWKAFGDRWTALAPRSSSRVSESNVQSPKLTRMCFRRNPKSSSRYPRLRPQKSDLDYRSRPFLQSLWEASDWRSRYPASRSDADPETLKAARPPSHWPSSRSATRESDIVGFTCERKLSQKAEESQKNRSSSLRLSPREERS